MAVFNFWKRGAGAVYFNSRTTCGRCHSLLVNNIFMTSLIAFSLFTVKKRPAFNISHLKLSFESITLTVLENDTYRGLPSLKIVEPPNSFPGSLILPPPPRSVQGGGKMRDPGNEAVEPVLRDRGQLFVVPMRVLYCFLPY